MQRSSLALLPSLSIYGSLLSLPSLPSLPGRARIPSLQSKWLHLCDPYSALSQDPPLMVRGGLLVVLNHIHQSALVPILPSFPVHLENVQLSYLSRTVKLALWSHLAADRRAPAVLQRDSGLHFIERASSNANTAEEKSAPGEPGNARYCRLPDPPEYLAAVGLR